MEKKKDKPWPWDPKLGGCQMDISTLNEARAEAKGQMVKFIPEFVKKVCTFKRRSMWNPKEFICDRCKHGAQQIVQEAHMNKLHEDYLRRMSERKAAPRQMPQNLSGAQVSKIMTGQVVSTRRAKEHHSETSNKTNGVGGGVSRSYFRPIG